jgi:hypothetical protein
VEQMSDLRDPNKALQESFLVSRTDEKKKELGLSFNFLLTDRKVGDFEEHFLLSVFGGLDFEILPSETDIYDILVKVNAFPSKGEARRNWKKTTQRLEPGCYSFEVGREKKNVFIWKERA